MCVITVFKSTNLYAVTWSIKNEYTT